MRTSSRRFDPKSRRLMIVGNLSLAAALILWNFTRHGTGLPHAALDGLYGLLMGISIGANLTALRRARRCRASTL
jgi:hypothetical protein